MKPLAIFLASLILAVNVLPSQAAAAAKGKAVGLNPNAAAASNKTAKLAAKATQPISAQVEKVDGQTLTVMTEPMMGPDGLIPAKEKSYDATNATVVVINNATKTLADLQAGSQVQLTITDDGKTVEHITATVPLTAADRAAKKAAKQAAVGPVVPPAAPQLP